MWPNFQAQRDLADAIGPALSVRRSKRDGNSAAYYDASFYSGPTLARLPEILRPKPGRLTNAQQRVYEVITVHIRLISRLKLTTST